MSLQTSPSSQLSLVTSLIKNVLKILKLSCLMLILSRSALALKPVNRADTVIFDAYGRIANPYIFNWMVPGATRSHGMHQSVWEPLFILNYETDEIEPWLGLSFTASWMSGR